MVMVLSMSFLMIHLLTMNIYPRKPSRKFIAQRIVFAVLSPTFRVNGANYNLVIENSDEMI